jgi:hypothetical protein
MFEDILEGMPKKEEIVVPEQTSLDLGDPVWDYYAAREADAEPEQEEKRKKAWDDVFDSILYNVFV